MKPVLKYPGSKGRVADKLLQLIPEHHTYIEPYFGGGTVFFNKRPSNIELINDLDADVINLFECIKNKPEVLAKMVICTPYAREVYEDSFKNNTKKLDDCEKALRFLVKCWQGHGYRTTGGKVGWKHDVQGRESMYALRNWYTLPERIVEVAERLRTSQIEHRPALEVIKRFNYEKVFMYIDPPYLLTTRSEKQYKHEMEEEDHIELLRELKNSKAKIMISGYESKLYNTMLKGWEKRHFRSNAENGQPRTEVVWMNYKIELTLFDF